jgi:hypothetical protein
MIYASRNKPQTRKVRARGAANALRGAHYTFVHSPSAKNNIVRKHSSQRGGPISKIVYVRLENSFFVAICVRVKVCFFQGAVARFGLIERRLFSGIYIIFYERVSQR